MPIDRKQTTIHKNVSCNILKAFLGIIAMGAIVGFFIAVSDDSNVSIEHSGSDFVNVSSSTTGK